MSSFSFTSYTKHLVCSILRDQHPDRVTFGASGFPMSSNGVRFAAVIKKVDAFQRFPVLSLPVNARTRRWRQSAFGPGSSMAAASKTFPAEGPMSAMPTGWPRWPGRLRVPCHQLGVSRARTAMFLGKQHRAQNKGLDLPLFGRIGYKNSFWKHFILRPACFWPTHRKLVCLRRVTGFPRQV